MHAGGFLEAVVELLLQHVIVAADNLLGQKLFAVFGLPAILEIGTVLAHWIGALCAGAFRLTPDIEADDSADVVLSSSICGHKTISTR